MTINSSLQQRDKEVIWHPYTQHGIEAEFIPVISGEGAWLTLADGKKILDGISSWWVNLHGHGNPFIAEAIYQQAKKLDHVIFAGFTHEPAILLAETLIAAVKQRDTDLSRCFYSDNGSTAVEVAMKMAFQYYKNKGEKSRTRFIALNNSYHGDTLGAMSLTARGGYHQHFSELLSEVDFIESDNIASLQELLEEKPQQHAALIIEPMLQGAGGMILHSKEFLQQIAKLCREQNIFLICDEILTGFYRTGRCFAFEHATIKPDFLCLSKGITGGFLPLAVTLTTDKVFEAYRSNDVSKALFHGHSYTANPIACAAALASWELLHQEATQHAISRISEITASMIKSLAQHPAVSSARCIGTLGAINLPSINSYFTSIAPKIRNLALENGVLLRPLGATLYALPPYCVTNDELTQIYTTMQLIIEQLENIL